MKTKSNAIQMLTSLVVGVAIGSLLTASLAPNYGSDMRKKISAKKNKIAKSLKGKFNAIVADSKKVVENQLDEVAGHTNG